jgi:PKD repeat protein
MNKQGNVIYFTANERRSSRLKIYRSEKNNNKWSRPEPLSFCMDTFSYFHPALSPDETELIFCSDRNKKNRVDLYRSKLSGDTWSDPFALNTLINDTNSQVFPFISRTRILYFSTDKKNGRGLDLYSVPLDSAEKAPSLLDFPVNSTADDFGVWLDSSSTSGYFSSNRIKKFKDDIFYFTNSMPDFKEARVVAPKTKFCYSFVEESSLASKDTLSLTYEWDFGDGERSRGLRTRHCFPGPGTYKVVLNVVDKMSGEVFISQTSYPLEIERPNQLIIDCSQDVDVKEEVTFAAKEPFLKNCKLEKVCWAFGDGRFNSGSLVKHTYRKPGIYTVQLGVVAKNEGTNQTELYKIEKTITVKEAGDKNIK